MRPFKWLPHDGSRHAIAVTLYPGDQGLTLCGEELDIPKAPPPMWPQGCWPECQRCDDLWRKAEGIRRRASAHLGS
ncbi:zinc finger protein [Umezawaea endophytica]|uniref:Zinc finger protein n=1 Tax=Umezawaea endophytica TaxID=1654476 RepID=A0A9X2VMJ5_9PSEU|nr:zinc finger protein [Umezawaea endophytica]MCS7479261.1 hypothetical protein [Umezawaea endophytica]